MSALPQYLALSRRSTAAILRQPAAIIPALVFPLLFLALSSAALEESTRLPGFPQVDSFLQFMVASTVVQGALFGAVDAGAEMATDIEGGFFDRLLAAPVSRTSIIAGRVMGAATLGFFQAWFFFGVSSLFGLEVESGMVGMALVAVVSALLAAGVGGISVAFGLRTGSTEAVQGSFPLMFVLLFLSSAFFPRTLMEGWFKTVADLNPFSYMIEGLRALVIDGLDLGQWAVAAAIAGAIFVLGTALSRLALQGRLAAVRG